MKIATLTQCAALGLLLTACPGEEDPPADSETTPTSETDDDESSSSTTEATPDTDTDPTTPPTTTDPTEQTGSTTDDPTTGPPLEGPGCGEAPACDRGELVGSAVIESAADIEMIAGYTSMTGWLEIFNTELVCLDFLACLEEVGHDVTIFGNTELQSTAGFSSLTAVGTFTSEEPLADQDGLISISGHPALEQITGFNEIGRIQESLSISENPALKAVRGFGSLAVIQFDLNIQFNEALENISGLESLLALGNECIITNNESLCTSRTVPVCGDLMQPDSSMGELPPGNTANNDDDC